MLKPILYRETQQYSPAGQMISCTLPDGSGVMLNSSSTLRYDPRHWFTSRKVYLTGEAYFKVKKGSRFDVLTPQGKISVLGTCFNVFARDCKLKVYCQSGKVAVITGNSVILSPGMRATLINGKVTCLDTLGSDHDCSWKNGEFWFHNAPLREVVATLERQFDITIHYTIDSSRFYTGYFNLKSMDKALRNVFEPMQISYTVASANH
jgi:ferric-dicitrate binding protein FerR (iron transport regulator)